MVSPLDKQLQPGSALCWNLLPSHALEILVRVALFVTAWEAGVLWRFSAVGAGPDGIVNLALFSPLILGVAIGMASLGATALLRLTQAAGWHGIIRMESGRLALADKATFELDATLVMHGWQATIPTQGSLSLPFMDRAYAAPSSREGRLRWAWAALADFSQVGSSASVYATVPAGRDPAPGPAGLLLPVASPHRPSGPCLRLRPGDLVELVAVVQARLRRPMEVAATAAPVLAETPARFSLFCSRRKIIWASVGIVGLAAVPPAVWIMAHHPAPVDAAAADSAKVARHIRMLKSRDLMLRRTAVRELGTMGRQAAPALETIRKISLEDPNPDLREDATEAVKSIKDSMAEPEGPGD